MSDTVTYGDTPQTREALSVYLNDTAVVPVGGVVCFDRTQSTVNKRSHLVTKPTLGNIPDVAGIVIDTGREWKSGPRHIQIMPVDNGVIRSVPVWTDENVAVGDFLGPIPGSYIAGKSVIGDVVFRVIEAGDGSGSAPVLVKCDIGRVADFPDVHKKRIRFFDHMEGKSSVGIKSVSAGASLAPTWNQIGTNVVVTYEDSFGPEKTGAAQGAGVLSLLSVTTTNAQLRLSGEPFRLDAGKSCFFQARVALAAVTAEDAFVGLAIADTTIIAGHNDAMGFYIANGAVTFKFQKGASGEVTVTPSPAVAMVAAEFMELSFLVRNRGSAAGKKDVFIWCNGTLVAYTNNDTDRAEVSDDQSLTAIFEVIGSAAAQTLLIDRVLVENYVG